MPAHSRSKNGVASLAYVAGIHVLWISTKKTWMAGTSPAMTKWRGFTVRYLGKRLRNYFANSFERFVAAATARSSNGWKPSAPISTPSAAAVVPPGEVTF